MKKWICPKCGYIMEIDKLKLCLVCQTDCKNFIGIDESEEKFFNSKNIEMDKEINKDMINDLKKIYNNECREIFLYLAMRQIAYKEGYYKIGDIYKKKCSRRRESCSFIIRNFKIKFKILYKRKFSFSY